jgi:hypothetical protein
MAARCEAPRQSLMVTARSLLINAVFTAESRSRSKAARGGKTLIKDELVVAGPADVRTALPGVTSLVRHRPPSIR